MKAEIITIGDELLIGQVIDTNSAWIGQELNKIGVSVMQITSISDDKNAILKTLDAAIERADIVLVTGGLGPTLDDITKTTLTEYFGGTLKMNSKALDKVEEFVKSRGVQMNALNRAQAMLPDNAKIILNKNGTASGMWFEKNKKPIISMPGVPFEMKQMMEEDIIPELKLRYVLPCIYHKTVLTSGIAESTMAELLFPLETKLPDNIKLAYLPSPGIVRLRFSATGVDYSVLQDSVASIVADVKLILGNAVWGFDNDTLEEKIGVLLVKFKSSIAIAESCTGGAISSKITQVAGASKYFKGGVIAYDNTVKTTVLGVNEATIAQNGAVSIPVVEEMAQGVLKLFNSDYAIATSGIAGPDGGTAEKPVGTVCIAIASKKGVVSNIYRFGNKRDTNISKSVLVSLYNLFLILNENLKQNN
ncbi:MAG: competence/damage-inducible protein A [Bacteroidales bacterium]|nr:competence/damage-inducible protein A [Bacteroidales bacterium]